MVKIEINGEFLDLPANIRPTWNAFSPLFQTKGIISDDYSFPIEAPHTDHNARILDYPGEISNIQSFKPRFEANLWFRGMVRKKGQLRIDDVDKNVISVYFTSGLSEVAEDIRERDLREIMNEIIIVHQNDFNKEITLWYVPGNQGSAKITINGITYEESTLTDLVAAINNDTEQSATALEINDLGFNYLKVTPGSANELDPFDIELPPLSFDETTGDVVQSIWVPFVPDFQSTYHTTYQNFVNIYRGPFANRKLRFKEFINYHNFNIDNPLKKYPIVNGYEANGDLRKNYFKAGNILNLENISPEIINETSLAPQVTIRYILERIEIWCNVRINFPLLDDNPDADLVILSPNTIDVPLTYFNKEKFLFYRKRFNVQDFVPDIKVNEFLKMLQGFGYYIEWDSKTRTINYISKNEKVKSPDYIDMKGRYSDLFGISNPVKEGVLLSHNLNGDDFYIPQTPQPDSQTYVFGAGQNILYSGFSVPTWETIRPYPSITGLATRVVVEKQQKSEFKDTTLAVTTNNDDNLNISYLDPDGYSLKWKEELGMDQLGLYDQLWDNWIVLEDKQTSAKVRMYLPDEWVWNPIWDLKFFMHQNKFLIKSFQVTLEESELMEIEAEVIKIPYSVRAFGNTGAPIQDVDPNPVNYNP